MIIILYWLLAIATFFQAHCAQQKHIVVVIPSYNNAQRYQKNLQSVLMQEYDNYDIVYIDDCSPDGTGNLVEQFIRTNNLHHVRLIKNIVRCGASRNIYHTIHTYCPDDAIIVILDGDDEFAQKRSLAIINEAYQDPNVWLTYGDHRMTDGKGGRTKPIPDYIIKKNRYRKIPWCMTHPRTYYAWLYKLIKLEDLQHEGAFIPMAQDLAKMYPMIEMSGGRFKRIQDVLYIYYTHTGIHHFKLNSKQQVGLASIIRKKAPYQPVQKPLQKSLLYQAPFSCCLILFSSSAKHESLMHLQQLLSTTPSISKVYLYGPEYDTQEIKIGLTSIEIAPKKENINEHIKRTIDSATQNYCCIAHDEIFKHKALDLSQSVKLLRQTEALVASHIYWQKNTQQALKHATYLHDNTFVFQLGWKPTLFFGYQEYMHVIATAGLKKFFDNTHELFSDKLSLRIQHNQHKSKSGLLLVTP